MSATIYYVERRGKPSTWLPRQTLAAERIPSAPTTIENFLLTRIEIFRTKKIENFRPLMSDPSTRLLTYLENFNRTETFRKSPYHQKEAGTFNQNENELPNLAPVWKLHPMFPLTCDASFLACVRACILRILSSAGYPKVM